MAKMTVEEAEAALWKALNDLSEVTDDSSLEISEGALMYEFIGIAAMQPINSSEDTVYFTVMLPNKRIPIHHSRGLAAVLVDYLKEQ